MARPHDGRQDIHRNCPPSNRRVASAASGFNPKGYVLTKNGDLYAAGWRLRTGLPLPAAIPWPADRPDSPDLSFVAGEVPAALADPVVDHSVLQVAADGTALIRLPGIGQFLLRGSELVCALETEPDAPEVTAAIFGNVLACLCWRRGQLALHGSAVAIGGQAILLLGPRDAGKSVLAAALARRGHGVLADEVAAVAGGRCFPAGSMLSLADDALAAAGIVPDELPQYCNFPIPKRLWLAGPRPEPRPYAIAAVLRLKKAEADAPHGAEPLQDEAAIEAILGQFYRSDMLKVLGTERSARREAQALMAAAPIYRFPVARTLACVEEAADRIEDLARGFTGAG